MQAPQNVHRDSASLSRQSKQHVFCADIFVIQFLRLLLGELHHLAGTVGEAVVHGFQLDVRT